MREKCAWEVVDGSGPCRVSPTPRFLRAALCKRVNAQGLNTCPSLAMSENVDKKSTQLMNMYVRSALGCYRGRILPSCFPT